MMNETVAMMNESLSKSQSEERQYLKVVMEFIQYLACQGITLRGNDHMDDNLTQLLLLRSKDNPEIVKRLSTPQLPIKENIHTKTIKMSSYLSWQIKFFGLN